MTAKPDDDKRTPGLAPGAKVSDPQEGRYGSPPASAENPLVRADSARALFDEMFKLRMAQLGFVKGEAEAAEKERADAEQRSREREERRAREAVERVKQLATYKALGDPGRDVGEIPSEQPGGGRRLVRGGQVFRYSGVPSLTWMEPVDGLARQRIDDERERRKAISRAGADNELAKAVLKKASDDVSAVLRASSLRAAENTGAAAGEGG